ncbi:MAG: hypothetical protein H6Q67_489 [Firmicutes bacterium]|nr:hypothetical protein [Bacillota bacterium]
MTPDEIVEGAKRLGATFNKRTLFNYTADKCLPEPKRGAGYGGKWVEYEKMDTIWATVAWRMIHGVYPESNNHVKSPISDIKAPRTPPKTVGLLHGEFVRCLKEYVKTNEVNDIEKLERALQDNCWRDLAGTSGLILRGMMAWYICAFDMVISDIAVLEAEKQAEKGTVEFAARFMVVLNGKWNEIIQKMQE